MEEKKKHPTEFKHSDTPAADGKFRDLGINDLADWLIKTRDGDMRKITGSLNQQKVLNKNKDPEYAKKMDKVREKVKKKLKKDENYRNQGFTNIQAKALEDFTDGLKNYLEGTIPSLKISCGIFFRYKHNPGFYIEFNNEMLMILKGFKQTQNFLEYLGVRKSALDKQTKYKEIKNSCVVFLLNNEIDSIVMEYVKSLNSEHDDFGFFENSIWLINKHTYFVDGVEIPKGRMIRKKKDERSIINENWRLATEEEVRTKKFYKGNCYNLKFV